MVGDERIDAVVTLWAAGVQASPLGKLLGFETDRRGCVLVDSHLNPPGHPEIFICGDLAHGEENGKQIPGVAQPAMQMGRYAAKRIGRVFEIAKHDAQLRHQLCIAQRHRPAADLAGNTLAGDGGEVRRPLDRSAAIPCAGRTARLEMATHPGQIIGQSWTTTNHPTVFARSLPKLLISSES